MRTWSRSKDTGCSRQVHTGETKPHVQPPANPSRKEGACRQEEEALRTFAFVCII